MAAKKVLSLDLNFLSNFPIAFRDALKIALILIKPYKKKKPYNCIIGISGGKDSTRQAIWVRDKLGLNPLLICLAYPPEQVTEVGANNISNLINLGFDVDNFPLSDYKNKSFYFMATDSLDRFGTKLEKRFTKQEIEKMLKNAGFKNIRFSNNTPYWVAIAWKK